MVDGACGGGVVGTAVYGDDAAAARGKTEGDARLEHVTLAQALAGEGCDLAAGEGAVALVGVAEEQIAAAKRVADLAGGRPIVGVNVEWEHAGDGGVTFRQRAEPAADAVEIFANSFSVVYSYLPLSIQGLVGTAQEGAVFKCVRGGAPEGSPGASWSRTRGRRISRWAPCSGGRSKRIWRRRCTTRRRPNRR